VNLQVKDQSAKYALDRKKEIIYACLMTLFCVLTVMTNTVGVKLFVVGSLVLPVSVFWFPLTFLITDIVSEIYGERHAYFLVIMGFSMNVLLLIGANIGMALPNAEFYPLQNEYNLIYSPTWRLLLASMSAYLLAQSIDVKLFHYWKKLCHGKHLWLRNNGSTIISQFVDTATVNIIFLYKNTTVFTGDFSDLLTIIFQVYLVKVLIALMDTPIFYLAVAYFRRMEKKYLYGENHHS
jgi:uncharacterized integral membrane protein (TIGR00697 family)